MPIKRKLLYLYYSLSSYPNKFKWKSKEKIFCLSLQKTGTTSFGDFFVQQGFPVVRSDLAQFRAWNRHWYLGEFDKIFNDPVFKNNQVFEDAPFWAKDFYKVLYQKFPHAKYVLFTRNSDKWFDSLVAHSGNGILGDKRFHAKNYENNDVLENPNFILADHRDYYVRFYEKRNQEIIDFFEDKTDSFLHLSLEDPKKWYKLAAFHQLQIPEDFEIHSNRNLNK